MKAFFVLALAIGIATVGPASAAFPADELVYAEVHFDIPAVDVIPGVAAVRASCHVNASGEELAVLANGTGRSTIGVSPGPCAIGLVLLGADIPLPVFNTTPLGRSSFYLPGIATVTLGVVDVTLDLVTSLDSTSRVPDGIASVSPQEITWPSWGAKRIIVHGVDGTGSVARSSINTTFSYRLSLALTVYALSVQLYHQDLVTLGTFTGTPSLITDLEVDLRPHPLVLRMPTTLGHDRASLSWTGAVDSDVDHLELLLRDATSEVTYHLGPTATGADVLLRPSTHYEAQVISVDRAGQKTGSDVVAFDSPAAPATGESPVEALGSPVATWALVALAIIAGIVGYALGALSRRRNN